MNKEDYNKLCKTLSETKVGNSFSVHFQNPTDKDKDSMDAITHFLLDNKAKELNLYTDAIGTLVRKYDIQGKIFFLRVWIDNNRIKPNSSTKRKSWYHRWKTWVTKWKTWASARPKRLPQ